MTAMFEICQDYHQSSKTLTVPTFNSCTKCVRQPGQNRRPQTPDCHLFTWAWMRGLPFQLKVALSRKLRGSSMCFSYICDIISMGVSSGRLGAGIKCQYCREENFFSSGISSGKDRISFRLRQGQQK